MLFKKGHIINAVNLAVGNLESGLDKYSKFKQTSVLIYCDTGMVSSSKAPVFKKRVLLILGSWGGLDSWKQENLPTEQKKINYVFG